MLRILLFLDQNMLKTDPNLTILLGAYLTFHFVTLMPNNVNIIKFRAMRSLEEGANLEQRYTQVRNCPYHK